MATAAKAVPAKKAVVKAEPAKKVAVGKRLPSLGIQIDALYQLKEELRVIQATEAAKKEEIEAANVVLMETMQREGVDKSTGKRATVSISENQVANVTDWDALWAYVFKHKVTQMFQRRVSDPAVREIIELKGKAPPGIEMYPKKTLNVRKLA